MASTSIEQVLTRGVSSRPLFDPMDQIAELQATVKVQEEALLALLGKKPEVVVGNDGSDGRDGSNGADGRDGLDGKDGSGFNWRGTYKPSDSYEAYDVVHFDGSSYVCVKDTQGRNPLSRDYWNLMAERGANGGGGGSVVTEGGGEPSNPIVGVPTFIQDTEPKALGAYVWVQTGLGEDGKGHTMWFKNCEGQTL